MIVHSVNKHKKNELKAIFYQYMSLNSKFNIAYSLIYMISLMNMETFSSIYMTEFAQYFLDYYKIILVNYLAEVFKLSGNLAYIIMTLNRYTLVGKEHMQFLEKITKFKFKNVLS